MEVSGGTGTANSLACFIFRLLRRPQSMTANCHLPVISAIVAEVRLWPVVRIHESVVSIYFSRLGSSTAVV